MPTSSEERRATHLVYDAVEYGDDLAHVSNGEHRIEELALASVMVLDSTFSC